MVDAFAISRVLAPGALFIPIPVVSGYWWLEFACIR